MEKELTRDEMMLAYETILDEKLTEQINDIIITNRLQNIEIQDISEWAKTTNWIVFTSVKYTYAIVIEKCDINLDHLTDKSRKMGARGLPWVYISDPCCENNPISRIIPINAQINLTQYLNTCGDLLVLFVTGDNKKIIIDIIEELCEEIKKYRGSK